MRRKIEIDVNFSLDKKNRCVNFSSKGQRRFLAGGGLHAGRLRPIGRLERRLQTRRSLLWSCETVGKWTDAAHMSALGADIFVCFDDSCNRSIIVVIVRGLSAACSDYSPRRGVRRAVVTNIVDSRTLTDLCIQTDLTRLRESTTSAARTRNL